MNQQTLEYSVCQDCLMFVAYGDECDDSEGFIAKKIENELGNRQGHFSVGIEATEDDPEGTGYEEFSTHNCELCNSHLAGSRHGLTLFFADK